MKHVGVGLLLVALIVMGYAYRRQNAFMMEPFRGNVRFNGSYHHNPVMCLAGNKRIPCTAFST
ncbi:MAG: hypothetical protein EBU84_18125 [Actinobacteria bacterium]|jgi:hypothetical protein|nr:hypothetical protein [Actinomycetota bacterium]